MQSYNHGNNRHYSYQQIPHNSAQNERNTRQISSFDFVGRNNVDYEYGEYPENTRRRSNNNRMNRSSSIGETKISSFGSIAMALIILYGLGFLLTPEDINSNATAGSIDSNDLNTSSIASTLAPTSITESTILSNDVSVEKKEEKKEDKKESQDLQLEQTKIPIEIEANEVQIQTENCEKNQFEKLRSNFEITDIKHGAVATDERVCSETALEILKIGGNAIDAAVTAALCLGIANPATSGIGGEAQILVHTLLHTEVIAATDRNESYDLLNIIERNSSVANATVAIPSLLRGLELAHERHGELAWKDVVEPVVKFAKDGIPVSVKLADYIQQLSNEIKESPSMNKIFSKDGVLLKSGDLMIQKDLATTLEQIMNKGAEVFYTADMFQTMEQEMRNHGLNINASHLESYHPIIYEPYVATTFGFNIVTPPSIGGAMIIAVVKFLSGFLPPFSTFPDTLSMHELVEGFKHAFVMSFSFFQTSNETVRKEIIKDMTSNDQYLAHLKNLTLMNQTLPSSAYGGMKWYQRDPKHLDCLDESCNNEISCSLTQEVGTHFTIVDKDRNVVSMTSSLNSLFGSKFISSSGVLLNDVIPKSNSIQNNTNIISYFSSISANVPIMIFLNDKADRTSSNFGRFFMSLGSIGLKGIYSTIQTFLNHGLLGKSLYDSMNSPRIYSQIACQKVLYENISTKDEIKISVKDLTKEALKKRGHIIQPSNTTIGSVQAISENYELNELVAVSDIRSYGSPAGY